MAVLAFIGLFALAQGTAERRNYRCLDDTKFTLTLSTDQAVVRFKDGGTYHLPRKSSSLAIKYADKTATLYLDGDFAAFVADDRPLPGCVLVKPAERKSH